MRVPRSCRSAVIFASTRTPSVFARLSRRSRNTNFAAAVLVALDASVRLGQRAHVMRWCTLLLTIFVVSCSKRGATPPAETPPPVATGTIATQPVPEAPAEQVPEVVQRDQDATYQRSTGLSVKVPKRWLRTDGASHLMLQDPDKVVRVAIVELDGSDAVSPIKDAWRRLDPSFAKAVEQTLKPPPADGFDEIAVQTYVMGTNEDRVATAISKRLGQKVYAMLIDGTKAGVDRRGAQVREIIGGIKVPGEKKVDLSANEMKPLDGERAAAFRAFILDGLEKTMIPGAAVAVIQDGKIVFEEGFGTREAGKKLPVTPNTLMMIGSITKSMTTLLIATMVDEKKITWDMKATAALPSLALGDAAATEALTLQHTVCACTGMPRKDMEFLFEFKNATAEKLVESMKGISPTTGFGETFQYSNQMVAIGGYAAAHVLQPQKPLRAAYEAALTERVLAPLGMKRSTISLDRAAKDRDHATPHGKNMDRVSIPLSIRMEKIVDSLAPSGAAWSSAREMSAYVASELARGQLAGGKRVASEENLTYRWKPQVAVANDVWYGLGWIVSKQEGLDAVEHDGGTFGFNAKVAFWPHKNLGLVILTNSGGAGSFLRATRDRLVELTLGAEEKAAKRLEHDLAAMKEAIEIDRKRFAPEDADWMKTLAGAYHHPRLGNVSIVQKNGGWLLDAGEWSAKVTKIIAPDGVAKLMVIEPPMTGLEVLPENGTLVIETPQEKYVLTR